MIDWSFTDEEELLVATVRSYAEDHLTPAMREHEASRAVGAGATAAFREIGLERLELPESASGVGLGPLARVLVNEVLGTADPGAALALDALGPAAYPLLELGGVPALERFGLPVLENDGARAVLAVGTGAEAERVSAVLPWVPADRVDLVVGLDGEGAFAVTEGIEVEISRGSGLRAAGSARVRLEGAPIAARWQDPAAAARALARARLYGASLLLGVLEHGASFSRAYAQEREAFGRPIAHHQGLAFLITDMNTAVESLRMLVHEAAWRAENGHDAAEAAATAFVEAIDASHLVGPNSVQILGGHGFMQDYPMEKVMREARTLALWLGGVDRARDDAARALEAESVPVALGVGEVRL